MAAIFCLLFMLGRQHSNFYVESKRLWQRETLIDEWNKEVKNSISLNIHGKCNVSSSKANVPSDITVTLSFPTKKEVSSYRKRPKTISKGNDRLLYIMNSTRLHSFFFIEKGLRWMIPDDHPGQNRGLCYNVTKTVGKGTANNDIYTTFYSYPIERVMYLLKGNKAIISDNGAVWFECGYFQGREGCETRFGSLVSGWVNKCQKEVERQKITWKTVSASIVKTDNLTPDDTKLIHSCCFNNTAAQSYKRVFVIDGAMDFNFHHFIADELGRIARYLTFLRSNPDIMVHIRDHETFYKHRRRDYEIFTVSSKMFSSFLL